MSNYIMCLTGIVLVSSVLGSVTRECIYDDSGLCISLCPPGTRSYTPSCFETAMSQRTCRSPTARSIGEICDYSRCDCSTPRVWDEAAQKCVLITKCSDQSKVIDDSDGRL